MTSLSTDDLVAVVDDAGSDVSDDTRGPARGVRGALARVRRNDAARGRLWHLDAVRGLAVLLMVLDHLLLWHPAGHPLRVTLTRAAMPLFFVLSGHLVRRITWRHGGIFVVGLLLPTVVPWIDAPNVLCWYVIGAVMLRCVMTSFGRGFLPVVVAIGLTEYANFMSLTNWGTGYQGTALLALMCLGAMLRREWFDWAMRLPRWFAVVGRYPLTVYVGHLLVIEAVVIAWRA